MWGSDWSMEKVSCRKFPPTSGFYKLSYHLLSSRSDFASPLYRGKSRDIRWKSRLSGRDSFICRSRRETKGRRARWRLFPRVYSVNLCTDGADHCRWQIASLQSRRVAPMRNYPVACGAVLKHLSNDAFPYTRVAWPYTRSSLVHNSVLVYTSRCPPRNVLVTARWSPKQDPSWV